MILPVSTPPSKSLSISVDPVLRVNKCLRKQTSLSAANKTLKDRNLSLGLNFLLTFDPPMHRRRRRLARAERARPQARAQRPLRRAVAIPMESGRHELRASARTPRLIFTRGAMAGRALLATLRFGMSLSRFSSLRCAHTAAHCWSRVASTTRAA